jgi:hypothetical protein
VNNKRDQHRCGNGDADAFVDGVLGRTTGPACGRALAQLDDLLDDRLAGLDRQLVQAHLTHCTGCRQLAVTLGWLNPLLPAMAQLEPGPEFLAGVLARTTQTTTRASASHPTGAAGLMDRLGRWWEGRVVRPDFALQVAYAATVVLVLLTATPISPLRGVPGQALQLVTAGPQMAPVVGPALNQAGDWLEGRTQSAVASGRHQIGGRWQKIEDSLAQRAARTATSRHELNTHLGSALEQAKARDLGRTGFELLAAMRAWDAAWSQWWNASEQTSGP